MSSSLPQNRGAVRRVVALAVVIVGIVLAGSLGLLFYTASSVDRVQVTEERALVANYFAHNEREMVRDLRTVTVWDDAYRALSPQFDLAWADTNVGRYYATFLGHAVTLVIDGEDKTVYAWQRHGRATPRQVAGFAADVAPLIAHARGNENLAGRAQGGAISGLIRSKGQYYLVAVADVRPETAAVPVRPGADYMIVSARRVDAAFLDQLADDLRVTEVRLITNQTDHAGAILPLIDVNGFVVGEAAWTPKRPGVAVMREAVPLFIVAVAVLLVAGLGLAVRVQAIFRELSANDGTLQRAMDELVRARDQAAAASVAKSQFLANMSHEIRTPLNGILGMTQVMAREDLSSAQRERLDVVRDSGQTLLTVLNDILDISKIEAGKLEIDAHEFDLASAVHAACNAFAGLADQKDVCFRIEIAEDAKGVWWGDGARLRQVIVNLASNAVKFTSEGSVRVLAQRGPGGVRFTVRDTGIGIPAERLGDLFQKFSQVDASTTRKFGGTGLGLAISRELVALMGGQMSVESVEGEGSTFIFNLPLEWRAPALTTPLPTPDVQTRGRQDGAAARILAAEDNPTNQLILGALLEPFGIDLTLAHNGREAVELFSQGGFDLILMDVQMPIMNGVEATAEIRRIEAERELPPTPILALSANVMSHQVAEYLAAGMSGFIPKPIEGAKLLAEIDAALEGARPEAASAAA